MQNVWENPIYTPEQIGKLSQVHRSYFVTGYPQKAHKLTAQMGNSVPFAEIELPGEAPSGKASPGSIRPETEIDPLLLDEPPRTGKGSGHSVWVDFAELVSDIDSEVLDQLSRNEIIDILVARDIINE